MNTLPQYSVSSHLHDIDVADVAPVSLLYILELFPHDQTEYNSFVERR